MHVTRRSFLRGTGAALALPWLESFPLRSEETGKRETPKAPATPPTRFACLYFSNGVEPIHWWAKGSGATMELGQAALLMMPHREDMIFIQGLYNASAAAS